MSIPPLCINPKHEDPHALTDECSLSADAADIAALEAAVGAVLFNVRNFPDAAQVRLLGQDMAPLRRRVVAAVLEAGFRLVPSDVEPIG